MPASRTSQIIDRVMRHARAVGCSDLIGLKEEATVSHLEYLDLLPGNSNKSILPDAVAEFQGRPLLYLVDGHDEDGKPKLETQQIQDLQTLLANRSEHACLGVVKPGSLEVYPINLDRQTLAKSSFRTIHIATPEAAMFFQSLATGSFDLEGRPKQADYVFETIHALLTKASEDLAGTREEPGQLHGLDVLSTTGRALFFRFLVDRKIVLPAEMSEICPKATDLRDAFSNVENAAATSCWLDETFNGDLLPLVQNLSSDSSAEQRLRAYCKFYREAGDATSQKLFGHLQAILKGWKHVGGATFQTTFDIDWDDFNFAHIPIGVLSQIYETFSRQWDERHAEESSVYYTPKNLAKLLVDEAFAGLKNPAEAIALDPACGAGVFLVLAFRQLIRESWKKDGRRPDTRKIQRILYKQLRGFEVSESALRLSALALYISAIEVNDSPRPPKSLKFPRPLRDEVLFNFGQHETDQKRGFVLGSLGPDVPTLFNGFFDIVVTNPPWTRLRASSENPMDKAQERERASKMNNEFTAVTRNALKARGLEMIARDYKNPDNNPDLPFLWRATEWAKPDGIIAMALPGRIILRQSGKGKAARDTILRGLAVTGILNGSDLEKTPVWPNMDLPFLLLFARNLVPEEKHHFHFATPLRENRLSSRGQFRLDYQAAETVSTNAVVEKPWSLKALAVGTVLDLEVVEKIEEKVEKTLGEYWNSAKLESGVGYKLAPNLKQESADSLLDLFEFEPPETGFHLSLTTLRKWSQRHDNRNVHSTGRASLYKAPLIIIPQAPGENPDEPKSYLSRNKGLCFSQSYYGYSANGHSDGELLISLLYLLTHSSLFRHFCFTHSSRIGASYRTFIKEDIEAFPFPDPTRFSAVQKAKILSLARKLESSAIKPWDDIDEFIYRLYGLDVHDTVVVRDTVTYGGPYQSVRVRAEQPPSLEELDAFRTYLEEMLQPLFDVAGQTVAIKVLPVCSGEWKPSWRFLSVTIINDQLPDLQTLMTRLMSEANKTGASRIILPIPKGGLLVGILNQRRLWTCSRARLCSLHIEEHHLDAFPIEAA